MSDEDFLARWSRRKQRAEVGRPLPEPEEPAETPPVEAAEPPSKPEIDLASLPPIDSIEATTDITAFLRQGIPQELSRAALRRAWSADPAIRDFVGLAENAWDFNDPSAMPGFGPLDWSVEQVEALVRRVVGGAAQATDVLRDAPAQGADREYSAGVEPDLAQNPEAPDEVAGHRPSDGCTAAEAAPGSAAPQPAVAMQVDCGESSTRRRTHGGALPR